MSRSNRIVITTTTARSKSPVIVIPDPVGARRPAHWLLGQSTAARAFQAMLALGLLGAACNEAFGVGVAMVLAVLVAPVLAGAVTMGVTSRGDYAETALQTSLLASLAAPALLFPGALLGWLGAPLWALAAGLARTALARLSTR